MELSKENKEKMVFVLEVAGIIGGICTFIALMLGPMFYLGSKIDNVRNDLAGLRKEFYNETKDFHGRLCALEERNKNGK